MQLLRSLLEETNFAAVSTASKNKELIDSEIYKHIHVPNGQNVIMLVGNSDRLEAHLNHAVSMGINDLSRLWIVDILPSVIRKLEQKFDSDLTAKYNGRPHFVKNDLLNFLLSWDNKNGKIYFVDFDGTKGGVHDYTQVAFTAKKLGAKYVSMVGSARINKDPQAVELAVKHGWREDRRVYVSKEDQLSVYGDYNPTRAKFEKDALLPSHKVIEKVMQLHGAKSIPLAGRSANNIYRGTEKSDEGAGKGSIMFAYLFKL